MRVLVINGGSSSFKCSMHDLRTGTLPVVPPKPVWEKHVEWDRSSPVADALGPALTAAPGPVDVVGHRIVHGGLEYRETTELTPEVRVAIAGQAEIAPEHNRFELAAIEAVDRSLGAGIQQ